MLRPLLGRQSIEECGVIMFDEELRELTDRRIDLANKYATERKAYGEVKSEIDIIYAAHILRLTEKRKALGYETGLIMLMAELGQEFQDSYKSLIQHYNNYKAIERMIDAVESKITANQSLMRFYREQEERA